MRRSPSGLILGYHGCDHRVAEKLLKGQPFQLSKNEYDWLGAGAYFWENDPVRAYQWSVDAIERRKSRAKPGVVGAVIVNQQAIGTPYRHPKGTPLTVGFSDSHGSP